MNLRKIALLAGCAAGLVTMAAAQTTIVPNQTIKIALKGVPVDESVRVSGEYPVSANGTINLPLLGPMSAAGLSPSTLATRIEGAYKSAEIYTDPTISIIASTGDAITNQVVNVGGHVRRTGIVPYRPGLTIYQAIQIAGGADEFGAMNRVLLNRNGKVQKLDVTQTQFKNFVLEENDTVEVPEKNWLGR